MQFINILDQFKVNGVKIDERLLGFLEEIRNFLLQGVVLEESKFN